MKISNCESCGAEYHRASRLGKSGKVTVCEECADEEGDVVLYTGNVVYSHKTSAELQINTDPSLTAYINDSTKLKNKGSNMNANVIASSKRSNKTTGACLKTADSFSYKNRVD